MIKKLGISVLAVSLLLSACAPRFEQEEEIVQDTEDNKETAIIPKYKVADNYYQTILPFEPSETRGLVAGYVYNRLDVDEFETGLMRIASERFDPDAFFFKEGQFLKEDDVGKWLKRKPVNEEDNRGIVDEEGLNPTIPEGEEQNEATNRENPSYLSYIQEHDYYKKNDDGEVELAGVVIGISLNSVYYFEQENGYPREYAIPMAELQKEGQKIGEEVLQRMRQKKELQDVPMTIALFREEARNAVAPGNFFLKADLDNNDGKVDKWTPIKEDYYFFPSNEAMEDHREDARMFQNFKADIEEYFPNYIGIIGRGFYKDDELTELSVDIPMQFHGKAEVIGFTQYVTGKVMEHFPDYMSVQVYISSIDNPEALIVRKQGDDKPFVHIYQ